MSSFLTGQKGTNSRTSSKLQWTCLRRHSYPGVTENLARREVPVSRPRIRTPHLFFCTAPRPLAHCRHPRHRRAWGQTDSAKACACASADAESNQSKQSQTLHSAPHSLPHANPPSKPALTYVGRASIATGPSHRPSHRAPGRPVASTPYTHTPAVACTPHLASPGQARAQPPRIRAPA
jgi:hypothetical protein